MTDEPTTLAEALARIADLAALLREQGCRMLDLRDRIKELEARELFLMRRSIHATDREAAEAMRRGTLAELPVPDEPIRIDFDIPPNAPR